MTALESSAAPSYRRLMTISQAADLWLGELERKGESPRTISTYRRLLDKLADDYGRIDVDELSSTMLRRFLDSQARKRDGARKADSTIAQNISVVCGWMDWLTREGVIGHNPTRRNGDRILLRPRLAPAEENDNVVSVTAADVNKLLDAADESKAWNKRLAVNALVYLGPRRRAIAQVRLGDYDPLARTLAFTEKGSKTIRKPVPDKLADLIDAAIASGEYQSPDDYLIPGNGAQRRKGHRDDRVIWRLVREVAADAGVRTHVHALRAAFAVHFLEQNPDQLVALQSLLGHSRIDTTLVYLRRLNRLRSMDVVRGLTWAAPTSSAVCEINVEASPGTEKEGFEPSIHASPAPGGPDSEHEAAPPVDELLLARARAVLAPAGVRYREQPQP